MKILVLFSNADDNVRKTIKDHLYCFERYIKNVDFHYCNVLTKVPLYLSLVKYDGIILHYTLLSMRWTPGFWKFFSKGLQSLRYKKAIKVAIPQDEYAETDALCKLFKALKVSTVFTCAFPIDYQILYPSEKTRLKHYITTYTGFVDEETLNLIQQLKKQIPKRDIDIGYRVRAVPFWLGDFGQYKARIAEAFKNINNRPSLKIDVSTDPNAVFYESDWLRFLLRCRVMPGCLGGASLFDRDGSIRKEVEAYTKTHPDASFEEVEQQCFPGKDYSLNLFALSPRHFECAMTKTCQVLLEGNWDIFEPGKDFIELKKDFSNLEEVLNQVEDKELCQQIAERAYEKIVESGKYTYRHFAEKVISHIRDLSLEANLHTNGIINTVLFNWVGHFLKTRKNLEKTHRFLFRVWRFFIFGIPERLRKISSKKLVHE